VNAVEMGLSLVLAVRVADFLLRSVATMLKNGSEKFQLLGEGILITGNFGSV
jgi:hypothetical protein